MKKIKNIKISLLLKGLVTIVLIGITFSCSEDFLKPDPLSIYEPELTYSTESGMMATLAQADRHLRSYWTYWETRNQNLPIMTDYMFSDLAVHGKTDADGIFIDIATRLTPRDGWFDDDDRNRLKFFWDETYNGISYANTIISYIDGVEGLSDAIKNEYKGRAYFHRAFRYLALSFQFKDVPLVTKLPDAPKLDYRSTKREAILEKITLDMEDAVAWVPDQTDMGMVGMVNKGACRQLLIKCYLATGQWDKAIEQADILINSSGYSLMREPFGSFIDPSPETWPITRNVIWDLHRWQNRSISANKEVILTMPNREGTTSAIKMRLMRNLAPRLDGAPIYTPTGETAILYYAPNNADYRDSLDYKNSYGRGQGMIRPTYFATNSMWIVNGVKDDNDLRHNSTVGNWIRMDSLKYNVPSTTAWFGKKLRLWDDGNILCTDTIRSWFDWPHYKTWMGDQDQQSNPNDKNCNGGAGDWYCYRLAETYLLRAEAKFYKGDIAGATADVNIIRERAHATQLYSTVTIGDIMAERARELYMEEWRFTELSRVSYCLALSGKADEWGNTYSVDNLHENSYWFQRITHYNNYYNKPEAPEVNGRKFTMRSENINWPIPYWAIDANRDGVLRQNPGYDGYDPGTPIWETWQEAVADEE